jgi:indolepyruvate ferredoxin oxidoreductase alpha subunit
MTLIISDNYTTAMTCGQDSAGTNKLQQICEGIGVEREHIHTIVPLKKNLEENIATLKAAFDYEGVSVILACRECIQTLRRKNSKK